MICVLCIDLWLCVNEAVVVRSLTNFHGTVAVAECTVQAVVCWRPTEHNTTKYAVRGLFARIRKNNNCEE